MFPILALTHSRLEFNQMFETVAFTILGAAAGGLIPFAISHYFFKRQLIEQQERDDSSYLKAKEELRLARIEQDRNRLDQVRMERYTSYRQNSSPPWTIEIANFNEDYDISITNETGSDQLDVKVGVSGAEGPFLNDYLIRIPHVPKGDTFLMKSPNNLVEV